MNDILGWYGYGDSVDRIDIASSSCIAPASAPTQGPAGSESNRSSSANKDNNSSTSTVKSKHNKAQHQQHQQHKRRQFNMLQHNSGELSDTIASAAAASGVVSPSLGKAATGASSSSSGGNNNNSTPTNTNDSRSGSSVNNNNNCSSNNMRNGVNLHHHGESSTSEKDSSRESSKSPMLVKMLDKQEPICQWCRRGVPPNQTGILGTTEGTIFCSESCFSQSRRASFKRAKTCDWCRHVRHAVSYVDFQDGVTQLQFCSDKCLNQYKMQIFCNETQAHLDMNPHLKEKSVSTGSLITPDLWLKNCKSRSMSPASDRSESISPTPSLPMRPSPEPSPVMQSPPAKKPMISVAPASKLLSKNHQPTITRNPSKPSRKRRPGLRPLQQAVLHSRRNPNSKVDFSQTNNNNNSSVLNNNLSAGSPSVMPKPATVTSASVQDLRTGSCIPKLPQPITPTKYENRDSPSTPRPSLNIPPHFLQMPPNAAMRPPFFPFNPAFRFGSPLTQPNMPPPLSVNNPLPNMDPTNRPPSSLLGFPAPPVTILVPYPIIIPLPLPIPIPIPLIDFLKATNPKPTAEPTKVEPVASESPVSTVGHSVNLSDTREDINEVEPEPEEEISESPLDFTVFGQEHRRHQEELAMAKQYERISASNYSLEAVVHSDRKVDEDDKSPEHKLPKFKITRLNVRPSVEGGQEEEEEREDRRKLEQRLQEEEEEKSKDLVERSRPLRKRKRIVVHHEEIVGGSREDDTVGASKG